MDSPFIYHRPLESLEAIQRKEVTDWLSSNLSNGQNSLLWGAKGIGKRTIINLALLQMRKQNHDVAVCRMNLTNILSLTSLYTTLANTLFEMAANSIIDWEKMTKELLPHTAPIVQKRSRTDSTLYLDFQTCVIDDEAVEELSALPQRLASMLDRNILIVFDNFQYIIDIDSLPNAHIYTALSNLIQLWKNFENVTFLINGTGTYAWDELCQRVRGFRTFADKIDIKPIPEKDFIFIVTEGFKKAGCTIGKEYISDMYSLMEGNIKYCQMFCHLCYTHTRGMMNDQIFEQSLSELLDMYSDYFENILKSLTTSQLYYLKAVVEDVDKFSSAETLDVYKLNSSANVFRIKVALEKKGVIEMVKGHPRFADVLFKIWFMERIYKTYWI